METIRNIVQIHHTAEGIQQYVGDDVRVTYAEGCHLYKNKVEGLGEDKDRFKEAVIAAEHADVVVLCLGLDATVEGEEGDAGNEYASGDKLGLNLPGLQEELLETITAVGKPVVLVLSAGSAIDLSWAEEHVPAILDSWYPGARGGKAVAEALFGDYAPNGKLPVTFYQEQKICRSSPITAWQDEPTAILIKIFCIHLDMD